jgi:hypothetical protein
VSDNFGQPDRDNPDNNEFAEDPAFNSRLRRDLNQALNPPAGEFRPRRVQIMDQIRSEATVAGTNNSVTQPQGINYSEITQPQPVDFSRATRERAERRAERRQNFSFAWAGAIAAGLVVLLAGGIFFTQVLSNNNSARDNQFAAGQPTSTAAPAAVGVSQSQATASSDGGSAAGGAPNKSGSEAQTTVAAAFASTPAPAPASRSSATLAAATTAADAAATTAAATTAAAAAAPTSLPPNFGVVPPATVITGDVATAKQSPLPLFPGATPIPSRGSGAALRLFLLNQVDQAQLSGPTRTQQGLETPMVQRYQFQGSKAGGAKLDDVLNFYQNEATRLGYKVEGVTKLQDNDQLKVRWIYLSKGAERIGIMVVESNDDEASGILQISKGEIGIFITVS